MDDQNNAENGSPLPMFHAGKTRRCPQCDGTDWRTSTKGRRYCRDCEKRHKRERKDRRHRERGDRCGCGADAVSLNPHEVIVHNWGGGPCRIVPARPAECDKRGPGGECIRDHEPCPDFPTPREGVNR